MYDDLRQVTVSGGITRDPEIKYTNNGTAVLKINLGCSESRKQQDGSYTKKSHYFEISVWGKFAETLEKKLTKGTKILCSGSLEFQEWEQDGQKRSKVLINSNFIQILSSNNQANNTQGNSQNNSYTPPRGQQNNNQSFEDGIPF